MTTKQKLVTKAEFSRIVGIDKSLVSKMSKLKLAKAMVGTRIDMAHASVKTYIRKHRALERKEAQKKLAAIERADSETTPIQKNHKKTRSVETSQRTKLKDMIIDGSIKAPDDEELATFGDMKLKDILRIYGTMTRFKDLLSATKLIEDILEKRIKNAKISGDLISREYVDNFMFGAIDNFNLRLLQDAPRTIGALAISAWESGETSERVEVIIRELISTQLKSLQKEMIKAIK